MDFGGIILPFGQHQALSKKKTSFYLNQIVKTILNRTSNEKLKKIKFLLTCNDLAEPTAATTGVGHPLQNLYLGTTSSFFFRDRPK